MMKPSWHVGGMLVALLLSEKSEAQCPWALYPGTSNPFQVVVADFNSDGEKDLAVTNNGSGRVGIHLGSGGGSFQPPLLTASLPGISHLTAADLNRDGNLDIAVNGAFADVVMVLYGAGNGTFASPVGHPVGDVPYGVVSADFNGDSIPDLAAANFGAGAISVILGLPAGGFSAPINQSVGNVPYDIQTCDFNEDGNADLVVANSGSSDISILLGLGNGTFQPQVRYGSGANPYAVVIADIDNDDIADLAVANGGSGNVRLFRGGGAGGVGDGTFMAMTAVGTGQPRSVAVTDFNGDGFEDVVVADFNGSAQVVRGVGGWSFLHLASFPLAGGATDVAVDDFNGDARPDLVMPNYVTSELAVYVQSCVIVPPPQINGVSPLSGGEGTAVTIEGRNFVNVVSVRIGVGDASFSVPSDSVIVATVPATARTGPVSVQTALGTAVGPTFTVPPRILSFLPAQAPVGYGSVRIRGFGFSGASSVQFNGIPATFAVPSDSSIIATVPEGATDGPLTVVAPMGTAISDGIFQVAELIGYVNLSWDECGVHGAEFKSFACDSNSGRPFVLVASFVPTASVDELQGLTAELRVQSPLELPDWWKHGSGQCRGSLNLHPIAGSSGSILCGDAFPGGKGIPNAAMNYGIGYYGPNTARMVVSVFRPSTERGPVSSDTEYYAFKLLVERARSTGSGSCSGCSTPVSITLESMQLLQPAAVGFNPILTLPLTRKVAYWQGIPGPLPEILALAPAAGDVGTPVTITGSHFANATAVRFNSVPAAFSVVSESEITTVVPAGGRSGPIRVTTLSGTGSSNELFIVAPIISSFEPAQTPVGTPVWIQGVNFTAASAVLFNGAPATFTVETDTRISAIVPADATDGPITVANAGGSDTSEDDFHLGPRIAGGINLSWDDCGTAGTTNQTFACDANTGTPMIAVASFSPMMTVPEFLGLSADLRIVSASELLPDWWKHGANQCRAFTGIATSFDFTSGPYSCVDFNGSVADGGFVYDVGYQSPANARLRVQYAVPFENRGPIVPGTEYYGFKVVVLRSKTTGAGSCPGCEEPMCIRLDSVQFFQPPELGDDPVLSEPLQSNVVSWQSPAINCLLATPVLVSVVSAEATSDRVRLVWQTEDVERATVNRRRVGGTWHQVAAIYPDGQGRVTHEDVDVVPNATYDYRLGIPAPTGEVLVGETRVVVPALEPALLAMARVMWDGTALAVSLSLPRAGSAQLELFDVNGRRLAEERLEGLAAGEHDVRVRPAQPLRPGVFFARLSQDHEHVGKRLVVVQ